MHPFALSKAKDLAKAVAAHAMDGQLAFIAGGTDLLGLMKDRAAHPERLLDINGLPDMGRIEALPDGGLRVGALARMSDVAADLEVRRRFPVIAESLLFAASGQLRNMATIGGNIMAGDPSYDFALAASKETRNSSSSAAISARPFFSLSTVPLVLNKT